MKKKWLKVLKINYLSPIRSSILIKINMKLVEHLSFISISLWLNVRITYARPQRMHSVVYNYLGGFILVIITWRNKIITLNCVMTISTINLFWQRITRMLTMRMKIIIIFFFFLWIKFSNKSIYETTNPVIISIVQTEIHIIIECTKQNMKSRKHSINILHIQ